MQDLHCLVDHNESSSHDHNAQVGGAGVTAELWEKVVNLENLEAWPSFHRLDVFRYTVQ